MAELFQNDEVVRHLMMSESDLFASLVPESGEVAFSERGRQTQGRKLFEEVKEQIKATVCPVYKRQSKAISNSTDLVVLVGTALIGSVTVSGIPLLPLSALLVKIGLDVLCPRDTDAAPQ
jgi:hypothetical protein